MEPEKGHGNNIALIYGQTAKVAEIFWEWRHKVMNRFFTATAGILVAAGWLYKDHELRIWTCVPFFVGACFSVISHLLDQRNTYVLCECYRTAKDLECEMIRGGGIFTGIENIYKNKGSYYGVLRFVYIGTAALFLCLGVTALVMCRRSWI